MVDLVLVVVDFFFNNLGKVVLIVALGCAVGQTLFYLFGKRPLDLAAIIQKTTAGAGFVSGFALVICAFDTGLLNKITNLEIYILISGISIMYVSYIVIFPKKPAQEASFPSAIANPEKKPAE